MAFMFGVETSPGRGNGVSHDIMGGCELEKGTRSLRSAIATKGTSNQMRVGVLVTGMYLSNCEKWPGVIYNVSITACLSRLWRILEGLSLFYIIFENEMYK